MTLAELNALPQPEFVALLGGVFEHSPWVAERAWSSRPFASLDQLHAAMLKAVLVSTEQEQQALVRAHPELAGAEAKDGTLTADSSSEQARLGFTALPSEDFRRVADLNRRYREKFAFPCIVALRRHRERASVIGEMERRIANDGKVELRNALEQIGYISRGRLERLVHG
jgi:2-oxo-4-hydroxy-4-carboxy-5-ureidoimidazoline decarboxylase